MRSYHTIIVADQQPIFLLGIQTFLKDKGIYRITEFCETETELLEQLQITPPDVLIIGLNVLTSKPGSFFKRILKRWPGLKIVVYTSYNIPFLTSYIMDLGVLAYSLKSSDEEELLTAINSALDDKFFLGKGVKTVDVEFIGENGFYFEEGIAEKLNLTSRELSIIALLSNGYSTKLIADELFLSPHTVVSHKKNILRKLHSKSTIDIVKFAVKAGLT